MRDEMLSKFKALYFLLWEIYCRDSEKQLKVVIIIKKTVTW